MASIYFTDDDAPFLITETPSEAVAALQAAENAGESFAKLTLGNASDWNAKPLYVRASRIVAVGPPKDQADDDE